MSKKYKRVLQAIFQELISCNIHWREIESLLHHLGAVPQVNHGARMHVALNGVEGILHRPHQQCVPNMKYVNCVNISPQQESACRRMTVVKKSMSEN